MHVFDIKYEKAAHHILEAGARENETMQWSCIAQPQATTEEIAQPQRGASRDTPSPSLQDSNTEIILFPS
jgi:hypothetical protein